MDPKLQKHLEWSSTQFIIGSLEVLYKKRARTERFEITKALIECKMVGSSSMTEHIGKTIGYVDRLVSVEFLIPPTLGTDILRASLPQVLLVSCVGIFPKEERRCSTVEISISLSENQGYRTNRRITQSLVNSTCTQKSKYLHPTRARGLSIPLNLLLARIKSCMMEICPRGNNEVVIILYFLVHDKGLLFMLELY
jgi:hypothetical protein